MECIASQKRKLKKFFSKTVMLKLNKFGRRRSDNPDQMFFFGYEKDKESGDAILSDG